MLRALIRYTANDSSVVGSAELNGLASWPTWRMFDHREIADGRGLTGPMHESILICAWSVMIEPCAPASAVMLNGIVVMMPGFSVVDMLGRTAASPPTLNPGAGATTTFTLGSIEAASPAD
ncbi:MAG: hypothetical protein QOI28_704 [Mycobacterium sp.]|nr:hypothetical protein [Mycobacterium sp.]